MQKVKKKYIELIFLSSPFLKALCCGRSTGRPCIDSSLGFVRPEHGEKFRLEVGSWFRHTHRRGHDGLLIGRVRWTRINSSLVHCQGWNEEKQCRVRIWIPDMLVFVIRMVGLNNWPTMIWILTFSPSIKITVTEQKCPLLIESTIRAWKIQYFYIVQCESYAQYT